jgi:hypothetical protein
VFCWSTRDLNLHFGIQPAVVASEVEMKVSFECVSISRFLIWKKPKVQRLTAVKVCCSRGIPNLFTVLFNSNEVQRQTLWASLCFSFLSLILPTTAVPRLCLDSNAN